jgi:DNA gyrase subunit A
MAIKTDPMADAAFEQAGAEVHDITMQDEIENSYLEYAYSVIHSRALPDARDGLKPVHRRILFGMIESGLRPEHAYVKCARVVGDVMGRYHPHGDSAIYDAMVRMVQSFSLNTPLIDGHGNFGSPDYSAAAMRYTEARLASMAMNLVGEINENTVDFRPTYDGSDSEPVVLPAAFPNLLVNGSTGIAVGMSTNMIPHNLGEVIAAARHMIKNPNARLDTLMGFIPGPDLPTGGLILGADQIRQAYETGRGIVRIRGRATVSVLEGGRGKSAITITELPYGVGTEKVIESIKKELGNKRLQGISDVKDLSDRHLGLQLVIEVKAGVNANVLLADLYKFTPMENSFGIQNLALIDGQPKQMGLKELLTVFLDHRYEVVTRRTQFRLDKAEARLHIVDGLLLALENIDEVVKIIRSSKDTTEARANLIKKFELTEIQTGHILDMPLRRLVTLEVQTLRDEKKVLLETIIFLKNILENEDVLKQIVNDELAAVAKNNPTERKSTLVDGNLAEVLEASKPALDLEVKDEPTDVMMSSAGILGRTAVESEVSTEGRRRVARSKHDVIVDMVESSTRSTIVLITSTGRGIRLATLSIPALTLAPGVLSLKGGVSSKELISLAPKERLVGIAPGDNQQGVIAIATRNGSIKLVSPDWPVRSDEFTLIGLKNDDEIVNAIWVPGEQLNQNEFVLISSDANLLRFPVSKVRAQGLSGAGVAGISLPENATVISFNVVDPANEVYVVTTTGSSTKVTPLNVYPRKGRATGGVRCHKFLRGEERLIAAGASDSPVVSTASGDPVDLPTVDPKRDASGSKHDGFVFLGYAVEQG